MLWLLLGACGYIFANGYDTWFSPMSDDRLRPLDDIPLDVAGCLKIEELLRFGIKRRWNPAIRCRDLLLYPSKFLTQPVSAQRRVWSQKKYQPHFEALRASGILQANHHPNECVAYSTYFSVKKSDEYDRAIFNGRRISRFFSRPSPVNLVKNSDLLVKISEVARIHPQAHIIVGDFRHWFHQQRALNLSRYFGVACGSQAYRWNTMPMGFSHSPHMAQTLSWLILSHGLLESGVVDSSFLEDQELPVFIPLKPTLGGSTQGGFMVVYYDNYLIMTVDGAQTRLVND